MVNLSFAILISPGASAVSNDKIFYSSGNDKTTGENIQPSTKSPNAFKRISSQEGSGDEFEEIPSEYSSDSPVYESITKSYGNLDQLSMTTNDSNTFNKSKGIHIY